MMANGESRWQQRSGVDGEAYDQRFADLAKSGHNPHGEADLIADYHPRSVLDAGCGTGRVAIELQQRGIPTTGLDLDPRMLDQARRKAPAMSWFESDLVSFDLGREFEIVALPGNVMIFLATGTEAQVVERLCAHVEPGGRLIAGFQLNGVLALPDYDRFVTNEGLGLESRFASWDREPFGPTSNYAVSVHHRWIDE